jgi:GTP-binding protein
MRRLILLYDEHMGVLLATLRQSAGNGSAPGSAAGKEADMPLTVQFLLSAFSAAQFPAPSVPEIAFLGRSNVGKSSLLNALVGAGAAKVSSTPGRTRAINFFLILDPNQKQRKVFADLPGYGYAKISKSISATWPRFIEPYLAGREPLALCICLVDANVPARPNDRQLFDWLRSVGRPFLVVATKADRLSGNERTRNLAALKRDLELKEILPVSARTRYGIGELWRRIEKAGSKSAREQGNENPGD